MPKNKQIFGFLNPDVYVVVFQIFSCKNMDIVITYIGVLRVTEVRNTGRNDNIYTNNVSNKRLSVH